jgi:uncharacterized protein DUF1918
MEAAVGDRIVIAATNLGGHVRDGEIIQVGSLGAPPYLVRWFDDGRETIFFPGPDAHVSHHELLEPESSAAAQTADSGVSATTPHQQVKKWRVDLYLFEQHAATLGLNASCEHPGACRSETQPVWRQRVGTNRLLLAAFTAELVLLGVFLGFTPLARLLGGSWPSTLGWALWRSARFRS